MGLFLRFLNSLLFVYILINFMLIENGASPTRPNDGGQRRGSQRTTTVKPQLSFHHTFTSPICLLKKLAEHNNITWDLHFLGKNGTYFNKTYHYRLKLGDEEYNATSISRKAAEEKVSELGLNRTLYKKLEGTHADCIYSKSAVQLVHEWAQKYRVSSYYDIQEHARHFVARCVVNGIIETQGQGNGKREARLEAAEKMWERLQAIDVAGLRLQSTSNSRSHNATDAVEMNPISRLYEIQTAKNGNPPIFRMVQIIPYDLRTNLFVVRGTVDGVAAEGTGRSIREAKNNAAREILRTLNLPV